MSHPLEFIFNFKKDPSPHLIDIDDNESEVAKKGQPWEKYVKDQLAGTRGCDEKTRKKIWKMVFPYKGGSNRPPDGFTKQAAVEIKKMESYGEIQLNSSNTERFMNPLNEKFSMKCRKIAKKICKEFYDEHGSPMPFYYYIINLNENTKFIERILIVDGSCLEEIEDGLRPAFRAAMSLKGVYERNNPEEIYLLSKMGLLEDAKKISDMGRKGNFITETNEIAVYKTAKSLQRARQFGSTMHPAKTYKKIIPARKIEKIQLSLIVTEKNYLLMPNEYRKEVNIVDGINFKKFKRNDEKCIVLNCERKVL